MHVQQKHVGFETVEFRPCGFAVPGGEYGEAFQQKQSFQPDQAGLMVIRNENCLRHRLEGAFAVLLILLQTSQICEITGVIRA